MKREFGLVPLVLLVLAALAMVGVAGLPDPGELARDAMPPALLAIGQCFVLVTAGIDVSVGALANVAGAIAARLLQAGMPLWAAIALTLAIGAAIGAAHALGVIRLRLPSVMLTLATSIILGGAGSLLPIGTATPGTATPGTATPGIPSMPGLPAGILIAVALVAWGALHRSRFGRCLFAVGGDAAAARLAGANVPRLLVAAYMASALLATLAGLLTTAPTGAGVTSSLSSVAAAMIGGASLSGAAGSIPGALLGSLSLSVISHGANRLGLTPPWHDITLGGVVIAIIWFDRRRRNHV